tara:strand:+ start:143 stop:409 length:267 start_codon:yes stop_codon:yes gene_type:complete
MIEVIMGEMSNLYISGNVSHVDIHMMKVVVLMNIDLVKAVANKVSDEDSVILWDILKRKRTEDWWDLHKDALYQLCLKMLEDMESEQE